jgi:hypothetical protein
MQREKKTSTNYGLLTLGGGGKSGTPPLDDPLLDLALSNDLSVTVLRPGNLMEKVCPSFKL